MNNTLVIVTGILGQDGHYLKEILLEKGFYVIGIDKITNITPKIKNYSLLFDDITDLHTVHNILKEYKPYAVFNLAGFSNVFNPWADHDMVVKSTSRIPENFISAIRRYSPETRFCQASSCLVFGNTDTKVQTEKTERAPSYLYGVCKNYIDLLINESRKDLGLHFTSAIFYNHESPYRGNQFFTKKVINFAKSYKKNNTLQLKNLNVEKDIGFAGDYMSAMFKIATAPTPDDYIVSTNKLVALKCIIDKICNLSGHNLWDNIIINNSQGNNKILCGDNSKIKKQLGWSPEYDWESTLELIWNNT
jgi:GDPmannose 4,6-dehydratase